MKKTITYCGLIFLTLLIVINPEHSISYALSGLSVCYEVIIPSLFPFFVCSGLLVYSGFSDSLSKIMHPIMRPLFNVGGAGASAFVLGIISGYPLGAVTACKLYEASYLSKTETERLLAFCNNSGPLFILGAVGVSIYHSIKLGVILYLSHIVSAILVGIIMRFYKRNKHTSPVFKTATVPADAGTVFSTVISNSISSILTVCGVIIFVSVISKLLLEIIPASGLLHTLILGGLEFVSGITELSTLGIPIVLKLALSSWIVGFAGLSVHLQVMASVAGHGLSLLPYITGKILHGLFSALLTAAYFLLLSPEQSVVTVSGVSYSFFTASVFSTLGVFSLLIVLFILLLSLYLKKAKAVKQQFVNKKENV